jgi:hypothetical protein
VQVERLNVQHQDQIRWTPSFAVVRSFVDQLVRADDIDAKTLDKVTRFVDRAEQLEERGRHAAAKVDADRARVAAHGEQYEQLREALLDLAGEL